LFSITKIQGAEKKEPAIGCMHGMRKGKMSKKESGGGGYKRMSQESS